MMRIATALALLVAHYGGHVSSQADDEQGGGVGAAATANSSDPLVVDLTYARYRGVHDAESNLNLWLGIRYAAPPTGQLRWQAPRAPVAPEEDEEVVVVDADEFGPTCPQNMPSFPNRPAASFTPGDEDCLFLNVYAPDDVAESGPLPVYVMIHGGGYGLGDSRTDLTGFITGNGNSFVTVVIQYRLGAFGFLSSAEVKDKGVLNTGLLDQNFALHWVQRHIAKFGGDPEHVTIAGESAGAGSVLLHAVAEDGTLGVSLFKNIIAASPWVPTQPYYDDDTPTQHYNDLAAAVGCDGEEDVFSCLTQVESLTLQRAANLVSSSAPTYYGNWAFIPVTDGSYLTEPPSVLLEKLEGKANGLNLLVGNNANEGVILIPTNIRTEDDLITWIKSNFVNLSDQNITNILEVYANTDEAVDPAAARYETSGLGPGTAVNVSAVASGQQQRAFNIGAEGAVICPSYWFATAFTGNGKSAYHYQYSVPFAAHGADLAVYYGPAGENIGPDLVTAFRKIYGNFITTDDPSISSAVANGNSAPDPEAEHPASDWPAWSDDHPMQLNINQTGGEPYRTYAVTGAVITQFRDPGLRNDLTFVDSYGWEGGRGERCRFWRELSPFVPQ